MGPQDGGEPLAGRKQRALLRAEAFSRRRWGLVLLVTALLVALSSWLGSHLELESDILELFPHGNRKIETFKSALRDFGSIDYLMVLLQAGEGEGPDELEDFADLLAEKLQQRRDLVQFVEYRFQPDAGFLKLLSENALLFLPPEELKAVAAKLTDEAILRQFRENRLAQASPTATLAENLVLRDPLGLMPLFLNRLLGHRGALRIDLSDGYYLARDGKSLILLVKPTGPSQDLDFDRTLLAAVRADEAATRAELLQEAGPGAKATAILARYSGNHAMAVEEAGLVRQDVRFNLFASLLTVSALYWLCYRRFAALLYSTVPLMVGQALTFAVAYLVFRRLNSASSSFTALLMGLGTDFTIVMYARYVEERQRGATLAEATGRMVGQTGLGVFTGAITSAGTFYALCISSFGGLFDLGFLIGTGILLCALVIVFLLPAMIAWNEGVRSRKTDVVQKLHLQSFGLERMMPACARHPVATVVAVAALTLAGGWLALRLEFDDSIKALRSNRSESTRTLDEISERFGASLSYMMAIAEGRTVDEAVALTQKVEERLAPFLRDGTIGSAESILSYLPPAAQQERVIAALRAGAGGEFDARRIEATFLKALGENGFRREPFADYLDRMRGFLAPSRPITVLDLEQRGLGRLVDRYVNRGPDGVRIVTYLYPTERRWKREAPPGLVDALTAGDPGVVVTGTNVVGQEMRRVFVRDAIRAVVLGLVLVSVLLLLDFYTLAGFGRPDSGRTFGIRGVRVNLDRLVRSLSLTGVAMSQLLTGVVMMLGLMKVFGIQVNYVNAFVATMILGVGIDYSIHLVNRMNLSGGRVDAGLLETGKAVVLAALMNVGGFGILMLGNYPALRSLGIVALLGSVTCLLTSLSLVPALMARRERKIG
ncbi:MAG: MMPL family transporter [Acidobacteriia bacterium]|nr:MMPL family transporter [Terriglobia bacterium]